MGPSANKCKGCSALVVYPVICAHCGIISHPGPSCRNRTDHPLQNGKFSNCGPSSSGSDAVVDVGITDTQSVLSQPPFPTVDVLRDIMRKLIREELSNFRQDLVSSIRSELADIVSPLVSLRLSWA